MNILILLNTLLKGGAEKQAILLARVLSDSHMVSIVVFNSIVDDEVKQYLDEFKIEYEILPNNYVSKIIHFVRIINKKKIEIIFSYLTVNTIFASVLGKLTKVSFIIGGYRGTVFLNKIKFKLLKISHNYILYQTIVNSQNGRTFLINNKFAENKIKVILNGVQIPINIIKRENKKAMKLITVGRFDRSKDFTTSLKSFATLKNKMKMRDIAFSLQYLIIGYGPLENEIRNRIEELNLISDVKLLINPHHIDQYYVDSDIYLSTSIYEGLSNTIMEAMTYCLPVVSTNVGDNPFLIQDEQTGYICKIGDIETISEKLLNLVCDYQERIRMGINGYERIKDNYSLETMKKNYLEMIDILDKQIKC